MTEKDKSRPPSTVRRPPADKIVIVGSGLCGTLLVIRMAQKGFQVVVYERRPHMRKGV